MNLPCILGIQFAKKSNDFTKLYIFSIFWGFNKCLASSLEMSQNNIK